MFEPTEVLDRCTRVELATLFESNHHDLVRHENRALVLAAAWADLHDRDPAEPYAPLVHRMRTVGGDGTPEVSEYAAAELGALQGTGMFSAWRMIAAALDLRHRFPRIWTQVQAGQVRAWQATKVAEDTRDLSYEQARDIDDALAGYLGMLPWPRTQKLVAAAIIAADPEREHERREQAKTERTVYATRSEYGLKMIIGRAAAGEVNVLMATINRLADILKADGDDSTVEVRRSKALGLLGQPGRALQLLLDHRSDPTDQLEPAENVDPDEHEPEDDQPPFDKLRERDDEPRERDDEPRERDDEPRERDDEPRERDDKPRERDDKPGERDDEPREGAGGLDLTAPVRFDPVAARPTVVLHYHLSDAIFSAGRPGDGLVRPDNGDDLITVAQLVEFLADTGCSVKVVPVVNPDQIPPVDGYEIPHRIRDAVRYRTFADVFPYGSCTSATMDLDHTLAYQHHGAYQPDGGPPGQTSTSNLGPLSRSSHRAKTHGRWQHRQPVPGIYLWRSPTGWIYLVTNHGTLNLGRTPYAHALWQTTLAYADVRAERLSA